MVDFGYKKSGATQSTGRLTADALRQKYRTLHFLLFLIKETNDEKEDSQFYPVVAAGGICAVVFGCST
jgi:hypothetical protein